MGGESRDIVVAELAAVESDSVCCVSVSDQFDWSSMLFVELQYNIESAISYQSVVSTVWILYTLYCFTIIGNYGRL